MDTSEAFQLLERKIRENGTQYGGLSLAYLKKHKRRYLHDLAMVRKLHQEGSIVELGSQPYHLTFLLHSIGYDVTGVDINPQRYRTFIHSNKLKILKGDIEKKLPIKDESVRLLLFNELFEHLTDPVSALMEANRMLDREGVMLFTTPNVYYFPRMALYFLGRGSMPSAFNEFAQKHWLGHYGHVREYTKAELFTFLRNTNFKVKEHQYVSYGRTKLTRYRGMNGVVDIIQTIFPCFRPYHLFIATKGPRTADHYISELKRLKTS